MIGCVFKKLGEKKVVIVFTTITDKKRKFHYTYNLYSELVKKVESLRILLDSHVKVFLDNLIVYSMYYDTAITKKDILKLRFDFDELDCYQLSLEEIEEDAVYLNIVSKDRNELAEFESHEQIFRILQITD